MNEIYINLIIIFIIIILFLAYILIAHFYNNYLDYKNNVNKNFIKTKDYINNTTTTLDDNIKINKEKINNVDNQFNLKISDINTKIIDINSNTTNLNSSINSTNTTISTNTSNINNFDRNLRQFIEFRNDNNNINDALFNYRFGVSPNLSMNVLRHLTAVSGMTVMTDIDNSVRICDNNINNSNCITMNINNGNFDIYPSDTENNNIANINIYNKNKQKMMGRFDLLSNNIYLGGDNEEAGLFIHDSNVYFKNFNLLSNNTNYSDIKNSFNKQNHNLHQSFNNYNFNIDDIKNIIQYSSLINGMYTIIRGSPNNTIILNFKSNYDIEAGKTIPIDIYEIANTDTTPTTINNIEDSSKTLIIQGVLNSKKISFMTTGRIIANNNIRIKITDAKLALPATFNASDNYISNTISTSVI